jgi:D-xylose transport system permease protein
MILIVAAFGATTWFRDARRRRSGLAAPPVSLTLLKIALVAVAGVGLVLICNTNRGTAFKAVRGVPWVILIVLGVLAAWTFLLGRTKFGRYLYAIGGNSEAARRAGINLSLVRTAAFTLSSFTAGVAGLIYASRLRSISTNIDGGTLVLYAVAAAVIGGTSLFGGRGRARDGVIGGIVVAAINNGMGLQGYSTAARLIVTAVVLVVAVTIDAVARRGRTAHT